MNDAAVTNWDIGSTGQAANPVLANPTTGAATTGTTGTTTGIDPSQSTLSASFGPYVQDMLSKGWGLSNLPYQEFTGERFAGTSPLQQQAFTSYQGLGQYQPTQFNTGLGSVGSVQDYMNPFLQNVVDIQAREARRQADISRNAEQARLAQAGAYGGSRQAIMEAERQRNLGTQIGDIQERGLMAAYDQAQRQRLAESQLGLTAQQYGEQAKQFGAQQGLRTLADQLKAGEIQRGIAQQPLDFGYQQFQESMKYPYEQTTFMQNLLRGLPLEAPKYETGASDIGKIISGGLLGGGLYEMLFGKKG